MILGTPNAMSALTLRTLAPCFLLSVLFHSHAGGAGKVEAGGTLGIYIENDLFAGTDRHYTSGMKLSWSSHDLEQLSDTPYANPLLPIFNLLPYINEKNILRQSFGGQRALRRRPERRCGGQLQEHQARLRAGVSDQGVQRTGGSPGLWNLVAELDFLNPLKKRVAVPREQVLG